MRTWPLKCTVLLTLMLGGTLLVASCEQKPTETSTSKKSSADSRGVHEPFFDNLGTLTFPITTSSELAQEYFNQGYRWTWAFNHEAARRSFQEAQRQDPECAMCYWGEAFVLGPNINAPMEKSAVASAVRAIRKAVQLSQKSSEREQALIEALERRYSDDPDADRAALDQAYAQGMSKAMQKNPDDHEIALLYVDSIMNLSPWDYWQADGKTPKGKIGEAIALTEKVLAKNPDHPGAIHLFIHLVEASTTPERAEPYAERLPGLMPGAGHMVHMAAHVFYRVGRYRDSLEVNKMAVQADDTYFATVEDKGLWKQGYHPHNIHFVVVSAFMAGDASTALQYANRLQGKISDATAAKIGWIQIIKQAPYFVQAHMSDPDTVLSLDDPGEKFPLVTAMWHYARGVAFARKGEVEQARREAAVIDAINQKSPADYPADIAPAVPSVLEIAKLVIDGRIAQATGDFDGAIKTFRAAVDIQDALPYLEPPFWYYPLRQSLGATLIQAGKPEEAEQVFTKSLRKNPNNGWALYGLMEAQKAQGNTVAAAETEKRFARAWLGSTADLSLSKL